MTISDAHFLRGWLFAKDAPDKVMEAIDAVIAELLPHEKPPQESKAESAVAQEITESKPPHKKHEWSAEQRAAAAERMRARIASGIMKKKSDPPGEAAVLSESSTGSTE